jgi:hypothetical protein
MKSNETAFPIKDKGDNYSGLSKRDYIAIEAMKGLIPEWPKIGGGTMSDIVQRCYQMADEMIKQSEK